MNNTKSPAISSYDDISRLHREHALKSDVRVYDYVDAAHSQLARMWEKRQRRYRAMGYEIVTAGSRLNFEEIPSFGLVP